MRTWKVLVLLLVLLVISLAVYNWFVVPALWYSSTRAKSISALNEAETTNQLGDAIGPVGLFLTLTNGAWIAIRYLDSHSGWTMGSSCAIAKDSGGGWFESDRHFCGSLKYWPRHKDAVQGELKARREHPDIVTNKTSPTDFASPNLPKYAEMMALENSPNLPTAREALKGIVFKQLDSKMLESKQ